MRPLINATFWGKTLVVNLGRKFVVQSIFFTYQTMKRKRRGPYAGLLVLLLAGGARGFTLTASGACRSVRVFDGAVSASVCKKVSGLPPPCSPGWVLMRCALP